MYYECPNCKTKKPPRIINYYPPKIAQCKDCKHEAEEGEFIHREPYVSH